MIQISPQKRTWLDVRRLLNALPYDFYDYSPSETAKYPFVYLSEMFKQDVHLQKDYLNGQVQITAHVWHNDPCKRGTVMTMMDDCEYAVRSFFGGYVENINTQIITDGSTGRELLHGVVEFVINY